MITELSSESESGSVSLVLYALCQLSFQAYSSPSCLIGDNGQKAEMWVFSCLGSFFLFETFLSKNFIHKDKLVLFGLFMFFLQGIAIGCVMCCVPAMQFTIIVDKLFLNSFDSLYSIFLLL